MLAVKDTPTSTTLGLTKLLYLYFSMHSSANTILFWFAGNIFEQAPRREVAALWSKGRSRVLLQDDWFAECWISSQRCHTQDLHKCSGILAMCWYVWLSLYCCVQLRDAQVRWIQWSWSTLRRLFQPRAQGPHSFELHQQEWVWRRLLNGNNQNH